jgi:hypothetical protein
MSWYEFTFVQEIHAGGGRCLSSGRWNIVSKRLVDVWGNDGAQLWTWTWFDGSSGVASRKSEVSCGERVLALNGDSAVLEHWTSTAIAKTRFADFASCLPIEAHIIRLDQRRRIPREDGGSAADAVIPVDATY